jgi:hypothetical protein
MKDHSHLMTWVPLETKQRFAKLARQQGLSESALLRKVVDACLPTQNPLEAPLEAVKPIPESGRLTVRLRSDDFLLLRERATARALPASTYVSLLVRAHLRSLAPLPTKELTALKHSTAELGAIGRNLNQIARYLNAGEQVNGPTRADLQALLRACMALRDHVKALLSANLASWEAGYEKAPR